MNTTTKSLGERVGHTAGPWQTAGRAVYGPDKWKAGRNAGGVYIAQCFSEPDRSLPEVAAVVGHQALASTDLEADANAQLMAAAPELLEALNRAEQRLAKYADRDPQNAGLDNDLAWVRAAIAKATGQS